jgi:hypothetical protein
MVSSESDSEHKGIISCGLCLLSCQDRFDDNCIFTLSCHIYRCLSLDYYWQLIFELTVSHLYDRMVSTHDGSADAEAAQSDGHSSPPPTFSKSPHPSVSWPLSRLSCCASTWPTPTVKALLLAMLMIKHEDPYVNFWSPNHRLLPKRMNL